MKLRSTIFAILIALGVLPLLTLVAINLRGHIQKHDEVEEQRIIAWSASNALTLNAHAANISKSLFLAASTSLTMVRDADHEPPTMEFPAAEQLESLLASLFGPEKVIREISLLDRHGAETLSLARNKAGELRAVPGRKDKNPANPEFFRIARQLERFAIASVSSTSSDRPGGRDENLLSLITPIVNSDGESTGAVLLKIEPRLFLAAHLNAYWTDDQGTLVHVPAQSPPPGTGMAPSESLTMGGNVFAAFPSLQKSMGEKRPFVWKSREGRMVTGLPLIFPPHGAPALWIVTPVDRSAAEEWKLSLVYNIIGIVLAITLVVALIARKIDRIKNAILTGLDSILNKETEDVRFSWSGPREVVNLAEELTNLARHHTLTRKKQRETEAALRESEDKFRNLTESAQDGIAMMDHRGNISYWNKAATEIFGFSAEEAMGRPIHALISPRLADAGQEETRGAKVSSDTPIRETIELVTLRKDGSEAPIELSLSEARIRNQWNSIWIIRDITDRKRAEEEARLQQQQLIQADKMVSLGVLISGVAHEINNPNSIAMLNAAMLRNAWESARPILEEYYGEHGDFLVAGLEYSEMREQIPRLFSELEESARRIKNIVQDLKDYAKQDTTRRLEQLDINEVARAAIRLNANKIKNATRHFSTTLAPDLPPVQGNRQRLEQVLINLIQNSCEALPSPEGAITITSRHDVEKQEVIISVQDTGVGIRPEHMRQITDPFFTTKRSDGGTGLGLSVSAGIVKEHGGRLSFTSAPGQGTVVTVAFSAPAMQNAES